MRTSTLSWQSSLHVLETVPELYLIISPELEVLTASDNYLKALSASRKEIRGKKIIDLFPEDPQLLHQDVANSILISLYKVLQDGQPNTSAIRRYETKLNTASDFSKRYWSELNTPVFDDHGQLIYIIHKITDVTGSIESEIEPEQSTAYLKQETRRFKEAQAIGHIGSFEWTYPDEGLYWSDEMYRIHGLEPRHEHISINESESFVYSEDLNKVWTAISSLLEFNKVLDITYRILRNDGEMRYVRRISYPVQDASFQPLRVYGTLQDVTEQVLAQEKIKSGEALLNQAESVGMMGSYTGDIDKMTFKFSDGLSRLLGLEPGPFELTLDLIDATSHPDDTQQVRLVLEQAIRDKQPYHYLRRIFKPNGEMRQRSCNGHVICDESGKAVQFFGTVRDITEEYRAQQELKESRDLLHSVFNSSIMGIAVYKAIRDNSGSIIDFEFLLTSELTKKFLGRNDLVGKRLLSLYSKVKPSGLFDRFVDVVEKNISIDQDDELTNVGLKGRWIKRRCVKFDDGLITSWIDITEKKQGELALQESNQFIQQITDTIPDIIYVFDLSKKEVVYVNKESFYSKEYLKEYIHNLAPYDKGTLIHEDDFGERSRHISDLGSLADNEVREVRFRVKGTGDKWQWFKVRDTLLKRKPDGTALQVLGVCQNITKERKAKEELKLAEAKLHEMEGNRFKEIVDAVINTQEDERARTAEALHNEFGQLLSIAKLKISAEPAEATKILNQAIIEVRKISYELMPPTLEDFGLESAINDMLDKKLPVAGIRYDVTVTGLQKRLIPIMEVAVYRIIQELLNNVVKHSQANFVTLSVINNGRLSITLEDNGIGISSDDLNKPEHKKGFGLNYITGRVHFKRQYFGRP